MHPHHRKRVSFTPLNRRTFLGATAIFTIFRARPKNPYRPNCQPRLRTSQLALCVDLERSFPSRVKEGNSVGHDDGDDDGEFTIVGGKWTQTLQCAWKLEGNEWKMSVDLDLEVERTADLLIWRMSAQNLYMDFFFKFNGKWVQNCNKFTLKYELSGLLF